MPGSGSRAPHCGSQTLPWVPLGEAAYDEEDGAAPGTSSLQVPLPPGIYVSVRAV